MKNTSRISEPQIHRLIGLMRSMDSHNNEAEQCSQGEQSMKRMLAILALLLIAALAFSQNGVQPNGAPQGTTNRGVQSLMVGGVHDFGPTSGDTAISNHYTTQTKGTCFYCHRPHVTSTDQAVGPLWARAILDSTPTYGVYNSISLDVAPANGGDLAQINKSDNYSAYCLSCHDGSQFLAAAAYGETGVPFGAWPFPDTGGPTTGHVASFNDAGTGPGTGEQAISHVHPVNFTYAYAAANDGQIYPAQAPGYVTLDPTASPNKALGRLFNGKMQCSSCHNPHFKTGIGLQGSTSNGALCVACHIK